MKTRRRRQRRIDNFAFGSADSPVQVAQSAKSGGSKPEIAQLVLG